jgi:hypothetical protein
MPRKDVQRKKLKISVIPPADSSLKHVDNVFIVVTEAFCPNGHRLISPDNEEFDGYPGIRLQISDGEKTGILFVSPIHGDGTKKGMTDWKDGQKLTITCPYCGTGIPRLAGCHCYPDSPSSGDLLKLFTTPSLNDSHIMAFCNVWGCPRSRTIDNWNVISEYFCGELTD